MDIGNLDSIAASTGGGFTGGLLLGYALKKVVKLIAVVVGLFIAGLAYLQYQQIASVNWDKIESTITGLTNATTNILNDHNIESLATTTVNFTSWYKSNDDLAIKVPTCVWS